MKRCWQKKQVYLMTALACTLALSACEKDDTQAGAAQSAAGQSNDPNALRVLAGSELQDLQPLLAEIQQKANVKLNLDYVGTLDGTERLANGEKTDFVWFSHGKYLSLQDSLKSSIVATEKTMLSPVILGVKTSFAKKWGWDKNNAITWKDIAQKAASGELKYAMTNPTASNSGFTALVGVTAALSGSGDALTAEQINGPEIKRFLKGQALNSGSSGFLIEAYTRDQDRLDGMINYENVLLTLNEGNTLKEKLTLIYPKEGIITADYPLILMNKDKQAEYQRLIEVIRSSEMQAKITEQTLRRPAVASVPADPRIPKALLIELPFPGKLSVLNQILASYADENRLPHYAVFVLDVSGSMQGQRLSSLVSSIQNLAGEDNSLTGRYARFSNREIVTFIPFSGQVEGQKTFDLGQGEQANKTRQAISAYAGKLSVGGGTALYTALEAAYADMKQQMANDKAKSISRSYSIVAMTDGEVNEGDTLDKFKKFYAQLSPELKSVKVYPILFGEGNTKEMQELAALSGGRTFDGQSDLALAFKQIRGYQ